MILNEPNLLLEMAISSTKTNYFRSYIPNVKTEQAKASIRWDEVFVVPKTKKTKGIVEKSTSGGCNTPK